AAQWQAQHRYELGDIVTGTLVTDRVFKCIHYGWSSATEPNWQMLGTTSERDPSSVQWVAQWAVIPAAGYLQHDGGAVWVPCAHNGIRMRVTACVRDVDISHYLNAGVHIAASLPDNANCWRLQDVRIHECGLGVHVKGGDTNQGVAIGVQVFDAGSG